MYYAVDLFAGCGGLSEGFAQAGFTVLAEIEMNRWACETLRTRHLFHELTRINKRSQYNKYAKGKISREKILEAYPDVKETINKRIIQATLGPNGMDAVLEKIDSSLIYHNAPRVNVLLGGPPCQPYSIIGRSRDPDRMTNDSRHYLYRHYLEIMKYLKPDFFVYENVPGLFSAETDGEKIFAKLQEDFCSLDPAYEITPPLHKVREKPGSYILNSAEFGVPQNRRRLILIGYKKSLESKDTKVKGIFRKIQNIACNNRKCDALSVKDAIYDLPAVSPGAGSDRYYGPYSNARESNEYQRDMRMHSPGVLNHRARTQMEGDLERYNFYIKRRMEGLKAATIDNLVIERPDLKPNHRNLDDFKDRFRVQWWDAPSSTITAHICKDGNYYIHPDIVQCRSFTVREAARCQSFPDSYMFEGPRTEQFKQVGNAVPPKLAYQIGRVILSELIRLENA